MHFINQGYGAKNKNVCNGLIYHSNVAEKEKFNISITTF